MGDIKLWKNKCELVEGFYFFEGNVYKIEKLNLTANVMPAGSREVTPADQAFGRTERAVPSQKYINDRMETYFTQDQNGDYILKIYIRTVTKNGRTMNFIATNSRQNERVDVHFDAMIGFDPFENPEYSILVKSCRISNKNGYTDLMITGADRL